MKTNLTYILALLGISACVTAQAASSSTVAKYTFDSHSLLAEGHWVKVSVAETGMYEITYDKLREMGFSDPSKVAVYGNKGSSRSINFTNTRGTKIFNDNPLPVSVSHTGDKLLFYGTGPNIVESTYYSGTMRHRRNYTNPYSRVNYYLLTDSQAAAEVTLMQMGDYDRARAQEADFGFAYHYHEKDLRGGSGNGLAGNIFLGEQIPFDEPLEFDVELPYCYDGDALITTQIGFRHEQGATLYSYLNDVSKIFNFNADDTSQLKRLDNNIKGLRLDIDPATGIGRGKVKYEFQGNKNYWKTTYLDYWVLTYPVDLEIAAGDPDFSQQFISFGASRSTPMRHRIPDGATAWDVTTPLRPIELTVADGYFYDQSTAEMNIVVFDPSKTLRTVDSWEKVANTDLHALQDQKIDFVIFTTETYRPYAERLAALHEEHDGIRTLIVTPQELFAEFTNCVPDPMAYRALVKMLWQSEGNPLRSVLFMGPVYSDYRNILGIPDRQEGHIAYEQDQSDMSTESNCIMDFYGSVTDTIVWLNDLSGIPIEVGVALLPFTCVEEADNTLAKIEEYITREDFSGMVNEMLTMSYPGDGHLHDEQAHETSGFMKDIQRSLFNSDVVVSELWMEGIGKENIVPVAFDAWNSGKLFSIYFGHAEKRGLGQSLDWPVSSAQMMNMTNDDLGFFFIAGCDASSPDAGFKGIGDACVIRANRGFIGSICATRLSLTNHNEALATSMYKALTVDRFGRVRTETATVGEAYAIAKDRQSDSSEINYILVSDPMLRVPVGLRRVNVITDRASGYRAGEVMKVSGSVLGTDGSVDETYNGFVTVKVNEPESNRLLGDTLEINTNNDIRLAAVKGRVEKGRFSVSIPLPERCDHLMASADSGALEIPVFVGTYDPARRLGASGVTRVGVAVRGTEPDPEAARDETAPEVALAYQDTEMTLLVSASDDTALMPGIGAGSALSLTIDGKPYTVRPTGYSGSAVSDYTACVTTADLAPGRHTAVASAVDASGNASAERRLEFTVTAPAPIKLTALSEAAVDEIGFRIDGNSFGTLELTVTDASGKVVAVAEVTGTSALCELSGLPAGTYTASLRHPSASGSRINSNRVTFSKID